MNPKDIVAKLTKQIADLKEKQAAALAASEAEGVSAEDRAKHVAEFDRLQAEKEQAQASLKRAEGLVREQEAAERTPATPPVVQAPHNPAPPVLENLPAMPRRHGRLKAFKGPDAVRQAERAGMWAAAALYGSDKAREWCKNHGVPVVRGSLDGPQAALNTANNAGGGYFVPDEVEYAIVELALEYGVFRRFAEVVPMGSGTKKSPRWTKGMTAYWIGQGNKPPSTDPAWDMIELVAKDVAAMTKMTRQLDEDSVVSLGDKIATCLAEAFALAEDDAGFNGDGSSTYGGITGLLKKVIAAENAASLHTATGETTLAALTLRTFWTVVGKLPSYPGIMPRWFCHKEVYAASMGPLQTAAGGVTPQDIVAGGVPRFLGYPVEFVNAMPKAAAVTTGVTGILFGDLAMSSKLGDRRGRTVEVGFENDDFTKQLMTILGTQRVDINNHTIVDPRSSSSPGPVIGLKLG